MKRRGRWLGTKYIVHEEKAFVYFAVPKVACSAVKTALLPLFPNVRGEAGSDVGSDAFAYKVHSLFDHSGHQIDKANLLLGLRNGYADHYGFAFVRNPWDRLLSCWRQKLAPGGQGLSREVYGGERFWVGMPFEEFAVAVCRVPDRESEPHFRSQHVVLCGNGRRKRLLPGFVGRFENLADNFDVVAARIGLKETKLPRLLSTSSARGAHYREFYDRELSSLVGERYGLDAKIFGYSF